MKNTAHQSLQNPGRNEIKNINQSNISALLLTKSSDSEEEIRRVSDSDDNSTDDENDSIDHENTDALKDSIAFTDFNADELKKESARCIIEVKTFCFVIQEAVTEVYGLQESVKSRVNMEQLESFMTALILEGPVYIFLYNLKALSEFDQL